MSNGIKRIGKGLFAIFMIKLSLVFGVLVFQACQTESNFDNEVHEEAKTNFLVALQESNQRLQEIVISPSATKGDVKGSDFMKENTDEITTFKMCLLLNQDDTANPSNTGVIDPTSINTFGEIVAISNQTSTKPVVLDDANSDIIASDPVAFGYSMCFDIPTEPTIEAMELSIVDAKNYLIAKGLTESDIQNLFIADNDGDAVEEYNLVPTVMMLIAEEQNENSTASVNFMSLFGQNAHASRLGQCAGDALGISAIAEVLRVGVNSSAGKKLLKKAIRKVASRTLGWVGAAIFVYEFGDCMDWW